MIPLPELRVAMIIDRWDNRPTTFLKSFVPFSPLEGSPTILEDTPTHTRTRTGPATRFPFPGTIYNRLFSRDARVVDDRTELNETNARKLYGPFLRPMSHVGSQPMTEFVEVLVRAHSPPLGNVTGRQSTTDGLLSSDPPPDTHQPPTCRGEN